MALLLQLSAACFQRLFPLFFLSGEAADFLFPAKEGIFLLPHGAAGHGAASIDQLAVQGDNAEPVAVFLCHPSGIIQGFRNQGPSQKGREEIPVPVMAVYEIRRNAADALFPGSLLFLSAVGRRMHGLQGKEGGPPKVPFFQPADNPACRFSGIRNNTGNPVAQGHFRRCRIGFRHLHQVPQRAMNGCAKEIPAGHDIFDCHGKIGIFLFCPVQIIFPGSDGGKGRLLLSLFIHKSKAPVFLLFQKETILLSCFFQI